MEHLLEWDEFNLNESKELTELKLKDGGIIKVGSTVFIKGFHMLRNIETKVVKIIDKKTIRVEADGETLTPNLKDKENGDNSVLLNIKYVLSDNDFEQKTDKRSMLNRPVNGRQKFGK